MDEVYSHQSVQYVNDKFLGVENDEITRTMLGVMITSIAGKYRDIVAMVPITNINAVKLYFIWKDVITKISKTGFDIAVTMTYGHSANMNLFNKTILRNADDLYVLNEKDAGSRNFPFYDNTHLFKNFYNNWSKSVTFNCPLFYTR